MNNMKMSRIKRNRPKCCMNMTVMVYNNTHDREKSSKRCEKKANKTTHNEYNEWKSQP